MKLYELQSIDCPLSYKPGANIHSSTGLCTMLEVKTRFPYDHFELSYKYGSDFYFDVLTHKEGILSHNWILLLQQITSICRENGTSWTRNRQEVELEENFHRVVLNNLKRYLSRNPKKKDNDWILYGNYNIEVLSSEIKIYRIKAGEIRQIYEKGSKFLRRINGIIIPNVRSRLNDR